MPSCSIITCKNDSRTKNLSNGGVSYHRFPQDPSKAEEWINATGKQNWMPSKSSTICSEHFDEKYLQISKKGYRYLNENAIPTQKILMFLNDENEPGPSRERLRETTPIKKDGKDKDCILTNSRMSSSPRTKKLRMMLQWAQSKIRKQTLIIKRLQTRNRRLKRKINNIEELLKSLKFTVSSENLLSLKNTN